MGKTVITPKDIRETRNYDDIFVRNVIAGLLGLLNNKLTYSQVWDDKSDDIEFLTVPFFYNLGNPSSEDFIQDNYITFGDQCGFKQISGNFDMIPRGMIALTSAAIQGDAVTNRFVMGRYQRPDENGNMRTYVSFLYSIPVLCTFNVEIRCSKFGEMLKIDQACREFFFKNKTYYITFRGMRIGCRAGFPDTYTGEQTSGYVMGQETPEDPKLTFEVQVESYQPVFDPTTELRANNLVRNWALGMHLPPAPGMHVPENDPGEMELLPTAPGKIYTLADHTRRRIPSDSDLIIKWHWTKEQGDIVSVRLSYVNANENESQETGTGVAFNIEHNRGVKSNTIDVVDNTGEYVWHIPAGFTEFRRPDITYRNTDEVVVHKEPDVRIFPDQVSRIVTPEDFEILYPGYFLVRALHENEAAPKEIGVPGMLTWTGTDGVYKEIHFVMKVRDHELASEDGVHPEIILTDKEGRPLRQQRFKWTGELSHRYVNLFIADAVNKDTEISMDYIEIV